MYLYAFQLGRKKKLCLEELKAVLGKENLLEENLDTAVFKLPKINQSEAEKLQNQLGGTIKIVEIFYSIPHNSSVSSLKKDVFAVLEQYLKENFTDRSGKIPFSISQLNYKKEHQINSKEILIFSKKFLKSLGLNSRFVNKDHQNPRPSTIYKAKVLQKGVDFNIIKGEKEIHLGQTITIQDIDSYSLRDYEKPARDAKVGMTPPKLAQIMLNLAEKSQKTYDPFCGTGTFLMEAMLMGKEALGSDLEPRLVEMAQTNCQWFDKKFNNQQKWQIFQRDARFIDEKTVVGIDSIVTEGYLGTPVKTLPNKEEREKTFRELANLHLNWLNSAHKVLPQDGTIVMCLAAFKVKNQIEQLPHFEQLAKTAGYKITKRLLYDRSNQIVAREIIVLKKH